MDKLAPYYELVEEGYLNSQEKGDLVLFNYTESCTYERFWNEYTLASRGIIFNKVTGECVARPFPKFFNLSELENKTLPQIPVNETYEVYNKEDGSLGILYKDDSGNWCVSTRGSFISPQALKATEIFQTKYAKQWKHICENWTLLFEIIYPENRLSPGARLVTDYGTKEDLILLAAIDKNTGREMTRLELEEYALWLGMPIVKKFELTIPEMLEMKKTLPAMEEGWVIKFQSGFRVKIKGDEYLKLHKILNDISPLSVWDKMIQSADLKLSDEYKKLIPEEILPEVNEIESILTEKLELAYSQCIMDFLNCGKENNTSEITKKQLGIFCQTGKAAYPAAMFLFYDKKFEEVRKVLFKILRPKGNLC